jgi:peroxin-6
LKEMKNFLLFTFEEFSSETTNDNQFIKLCFDKAKQTRLKKEKTISSIPEVKWENVGGLEHAKEDINDTIQLPMKYPRLFNNSLKKRSGLLLFGPPGSGKTLLAKAIANECSMNFISVKGPELLNMYVGESEKNIREVFERSRNNRPCVLFFDEIDALAPARNKNSDQNNVMDRIVAQFMTEMDGLIKSEDLILIASTNRPDLIDPSLLRPGRFDKMVYVGLPKTPEEKIKIYQAQTKKLKLADDVDFVNLANISPEDYSGADIFAVCSHAFTISLKESIKNQDVQSDNIIVSMNHFLNAIKKISPSLPKSEIQKYEELKIKFCSLEKL